jgi:UDPglucose--hexose-1-phosphate uridylyltransferase
MHELRKDPLLGRWVIVAKNFKKALTDYIFDSSESHKRALDQISYQERCGLCSGNENETPSEIMAYRETSTLPNSPGWWTRVFPNQYPVLKVEGVLNRQGVGMYDKMNGIGAHEIIVESPEHNKRPEEMDISQMERVILTYRDRISDLEKDCRLRYILIYKDHGSRFSVNGTSLHPHSQLIATPVIPKKIKEELDGAKAYYDYKERCIFCDIMKEELKTGVRIVEERGSFVAFCPFAPLSPFEVWIMPKRHTCSFTEIVKEETVDLAGILRSVLLRIRDVLNMPDYSYTLHTAPNRIPRGGHWHTLKDDFHWHLEILPRITKAEGFEWGGGFYIISTPPEEAARYLRERKKG